MNTVHTNNKTHVILYLVQAADIYTIFYKIVYYGITDLCWQTYIYTIKSWHTQWHEM